MVDDLQDELRDGQCVPWDEGFIGRAARMSGGVQVHVSGRRLP
jgi:hypothetical protein